MTTKERIKKLEKQNEMIMGYLGALISTVNKQNVYTKANVNGVRNGVFINSADISVNRSDISDNRVGIEESFEATLDNTDDISDLRTALEEVYEIIEEGE